jgi:hypothetical protein
LFLVPVLANADDEPWPGLQAGLMPRLRERGDDDLAAVVGWVPDGKAIGLPWAPRDELIYCAASDETAMTSRVRQPAG